MTAERAQGRAALFVTLTLLIGLGWWWLARTTSDALVVYCAHDLLYAEDLLRDFERETGIPIVIVGDTEATKSLGLVQRLIREQDAPVCDVFWNNELLGTVDLGRRGILESYQGPGWERMPERFKDDDGLWIGFGGRLRVWIVNPHFDPPARFNGLGQPVGFEFKNLAVAQPMFGTTLTQYTLMHAQQGGHDVQQYHRSLKEAGVSFVSGNATVKDLVAEGVCAIGMTDTDDVFQAIDAGATVEMQPIRLTGGETICIPNTVGIIRGTDQRAAAEKLIDYLTSPAAELRLARSKSRQIPLGAVPTKDVPEDVQPLVVWARESVRLKDDSLIDARAECLGWLAEEFAP